jgi:hypothetical protein
MANTFDANTGRTTRQMMSAPEGAVFVWRNSDLSYVRRLARAIERHDLKIVGPSYLSGFCWRGSNVSAVVIDHSAVLEPRQIESLAVLQGIIKLDQVRTIKQKTSAFQESTVLLHDSPEKIRAAGEYHNASNDPVDPIAAAVLRAAAMDMQKRGMDHISIKFLLAIAEKFEPLS